MSKVGVRLVSIDFRLVLLSLLLVHATRGEFLMYRRQLLELFSGIWEDVPAYTESQES